MQVNKQKYSPIKQRILYFVENLSISKREFYSKTGISRGTLERLTGITEDTLVKFVAVYQNISPAWLLFGTGEMTNTIKPPIISTANEEKVNYGNKLPPGPCQQCELRERLLSAKEETILTLKTICDNTNKIPNSDL